MEHNGKKCGCEHCGKKITIDEEGNNPNSPSCCEQEMEEEK